VARVFSTPAGFALLLGLQFLDDEERRDHAHGVASEFAIDPRLEPLIPVPQKSKKWIDQYQIVIDGLRELSALPEPEHTRSIEQLMKASE